MTKLPPSPKHQRLFGAYYTPARVAEVLTQWAIRSPDDCVLEPGFGGCGFLESATAQLEILGCNSPIKNVYGCDIDSRAFLYLKQKFGDFNYDNQFIEGDFLSLTAGSFNRSEFTVAIGNPPYVSQHNMTGDQKKSAEIALEFANISLDKKASLWAYFILHSLQFLSEAGRCAWVLPVSFVYADYSSSVKKTLISKFAKISVIHLTERLFLEASAKERTVILLAEGFQSKDANRPLDHFYANDLNELEKITKNLRKGETARDETTLILPSVEALDNQVFRKIRNNPSHITLGEAVEIKIGIVTGANSFFILDKKTANENQIESRFFRPILAKMNQSKGLEVSEGDLNLSYERNQRCMLLTPSEEDVKNPHIDSYLSQFPKEKQEANKTFKKRKLWYRPLEGKTPDAFLSYMCDHGPRLILNECATNSSNTIHRCYIRDIFKSEAKLLAISMLTSFSQISAELVGRSYGSGVLKLEPSEAKKIELILPENINKLALQRKFNEIDSLLRDNKLAEAHDKADQFIYGSIRLENVEGASHTLRELIVKLRNQRRIRKLYE
jgi:adenine-specific DNA-methyltransferase